MSCAHEYYWYQAYCNEDGWRCRLCKDRPGEPPGFSPQLDRENTYSKVFAVMQDLHDAKFIYISNGTGGDCLSNDVAERCKRDNRFDQASIALFILEAVTPSHAKYWAEISDGILTGKDPRKRCHCGRLAYISRGDRHWCSSECERQMDLAL